MQLLQNEIQTLNLSNTVAALYYYSANKPTGSWSLSQFVITNPCKDEHVTMNI